MRSLWLIFAQVVTATLAVIFVVSLAKPEWLPWRARDVVAVVEAPAAGKAPIQAQGPAGRAVSFHEAAGKAVLSVVNISTRKEIRLPPEDPRNNPLFRRFFGIPAPQAQRSLGSGVIVSREGYVLTNFHVVQGADQIEAFLADGRTLAASVVGSDPDTDLAVLKLNAPNLVPITFTQADTARIGDVVLAIGDPFGVGQTVTMGIVSAVGKRGIGDSDLVDFIQTDAAINPGNSGGALVDVAGNLVGINSMIYSESGGSQGIGFAIPASLARNVMEQIIESGAVRRGFFGILSTNIDAESARALGLTDGPGPLVRRVSAGSPADRAGLKPGDLLVSINGKAVQDTLAVNRVILDLKPGETVPVVVKRGSERITLSVTVGERRRTG
jgi:serine protease DegQ